MKSIYFTTVFLIIFLVISQINTANLTLLNGLFITGNVLVVFMVYKVLKEYYKTSKNFQHWYEDNPRTTQK